MMPPNDMFGSVSSSSSIPADTGRRVSISDPPDSIIPLQQQELDGDDHLSQSDGSVDPTAMSLEQLLDYVRGVDDQGPATLALIVEHLLSFYKQLDPKYEGYLTLWKDHLPAGCTRMQVALDDFYQKLQLQHYTQDPAPFMHLGNRFDKSPKYEQLARVLATFAILEAPETSEPSIPIFFTMLLQFIGQPFSMDLDLAALTKFMKKAKGANWKWSQLPLGARVATPEPSEEEVSMQDSLARLIAGKNPDDPDVMEILQTIDRLSRNKRASSEERILPTAKTHRTGMPFPTVSRRAHTGSVRKNQTDQEVHHEEMDIFPSANDPDQQNSEEELRKIQQRFINKFRKPKDEVDRPKLATFAKNAGGKHKHVQMTREIFKSVASSDDTLDPVTYIDPDTNFKLLRPNQTKRYNAEELQIQMYLLMPMPWHLIEWDQVELGKSSVLDVPIPAYLRAWFHDRKKNQAGTSMVTTFDEEDEDFKAKLYEYTNCELDVYRLNWINAVVLRRDVAVTMTYMHAMNVLEIKDGRPTVAAQDYLGWNHCGFPECETANPKNSWKTTIPTQRLWQGTKVCDVHKKVKSNSEV